MFEDVDDDALLDAALQTSACTARDAHRPTTREFQRLYRYLIGQGFEADRVLARLRAVRGTES